MNTLLDRGLSNRGVAAAIVDAGGSLDPDVVGRHKARHWTKPVPAGAPRPTRGDLAILVRDKAYDVVEDMTPDALVALSKEVGPIIGKGLQAQAILDKREVNDKKLGLAAGALSLQAWLAGLSKSEPPPELDDGNTVEGFATEVET